MFDFLKLRNVANLLAKQGGEEFDRSAISRYYYSLFGCARLYLILVMGETSFLKTKSIHTKVCMRLKDSDDSTEKELGKILYDLRQLRNIADYEWDKYDSSFFEKRLDFVSKESKVGIQHVNALKKSPPYRL